MPNLTDNQPTRRPRRGQGAVIGERSRPWRIVPLAFVAVLGTVGLMGGAMAMVRDLSDGRYAQEVLQDRFAEMDVGKEKTAQP